MKLQLQTVLMFCNWLFALYEQFLKYYYLYSSHACATLVMG